MDCVLMYTSRSDLDGTFFWGPSDGREHCSEVLKSVGTDGVCGAVDDLMDWLERLRAAEVV